MPDAPVGMDAFAALAQLQAKLPTVSFDKENPHFHNRYASLAAIMDAIRPLMGEHGFSWVATPTILGSDSQDPGEIGLVYYLYHSSGECVAGGTYPLPGGATPQALGAAITYARRYTLCSVLNLVADEDDDGNTASGVTTPAKARAPRQAAQIPGKDRPFQEGDPCPVCLVEGFRGKLKPNKFGPGLQCTGKDGDTWLNHVVPDAAMAATIEPDGVATLLRAYTALTAATRTRIIADLDYSPAPGMTVKQWAATLTPQQLAEVTDHLTSAFSEKGATIERREEGSTGGPGSDASGASASPEAGGSEGGGTSPSVASSPVTNPSLETVLAAFQQAGMKARALALERTDFPGGQTQPLDHIRGLGPTGLAIAYAALTT